MRYLSFNLSNLKNAEIEAVESFKSVIDMYIYIYIYMF